MRTNLVAVSHSDKDEKMVYVTASGLCSARLQAAILGLAGCPPEGGRYTNPSHTSSEREYDLAKPFPEEAQK